MSRVLCVLLRFCLKEEGEGEDTDGHSLEMNQKIASECKTLQEGVKRLFGLHEVHIGN